MLKLIQFRHRINQCILGLLVIIPVDVSNAQVGNVTYTHDPSIIKQDGSYYIFSTGYGIPIRRSNDLYNWQSIGSVFTTIPDWALDEIPGATNIWAPDISFRNNTYYLYYSISTFGSNRSCIGLATNTTLAPNDPDYAWIDQGKVICSKSYNNWNAIDPNLVMDDSGSVWLSFGSFWSGIKMVALDSTTMKPESENPSLISLARRSTDPAIEAPFIIRKNGYYYLFVSFDNCCRGVESTYKIMVGRSSQVTGPYVDRAGNQMLSEGGTLLLHSTDRWRGPGHNAVLMENDSDWLIYHAYDAQNNGIPTLRIRSLAWTADGWPVVGGTIQLNNENAPLKPTAFVLYQNYPNPFNPITTLRYDLSEQSYVTVIIYDLRGKQVRSFINTIQNAGYKTVLWNGTDENGIAVSSGIYFYQLWAGNFVQTKRMLLLR